MKPLDRPPIRMRAAPDAWVDLVLTSVRLLTFSATLVAAWLAMRAGDPLRAAGAAAVGWLIDARARVAVLSRLDTATVTDQIVTTWGRRRVLPLDALAAVTWLRAPDGEARVRWQAHLVDDNGGRSVLTLHSPAGFEPDHAVDVERCEPVLGPASLWSPPGLAPRAPLADPDGSSLVALCARLAEVVDPRPGVVVRDGDGTLSIWRIDGDALLRGSEPGLLAADAALSRDPRDDEPSFLLSWPGGPHLRFPGPGAAGLPPRASDPPSSVEPVDGAVLLRWVATHNPELTPWLWRLAPDTASALGAPPAPDVLARRP